MVHFVSLKLLSIKKYIFKNKCDMTKQNTAQPRRRKFRRMTKSIAVLINDARSYFEKEAAANTRLNLTRPVKRTAACLDISETLVNRASKWRECIDELPEDDEFETRNRERTVSESFYPVIRSTIFRMFHNKNHVTLDTLQKELEQLPRTRSNGWKWSRATLHRVLTDNMQFTYGKRPSHYDTIREKESIALQRIQYIRAIRQYRAEGRPIFYQDETWVFKNMTPENVWLDEDGKGGPKVPNGPGMRSIDSHVGSENGFIDGAALLFRGKHALKDSDYHVEMNSFVFLDWLEKKVFPRIPSRSILVIDRATYHTTLTEETKPAASNFRKSEHAKWLIDKDVQYVQDGITLTTYDDFMTLSKVELQVICKQNKPVPKFVVQALAQKFDCDILFLPVSYPELNPIEMVWGNVKGYVAKNNIHFSLAEVEQLTLERFGQIGAEEWSKCVNHCVKVEDEYFDTVDSVPFEIEETG